MKQTEQSVGQNDPSQSGSPAIAAVRPWMLGTLVFVLAAGAMGRMCTHEFIGWDDNMTITGNPRMNPPTLATLKHYWTSGEFGLYIPGTYTVWAGLSAIARTAEEDTRGIRLNPYVFHTANVLLHATAALAAFALLMRLLRASSVAQPSAVTEAESNTQPWATIPHRYWAAFFGAALFAVHPVQVESVGWVSGMKDVLCGLFSLVALWQYVRAAQADSTRSRRIHLVLATAALAWAMLCKPTAMVVPAIAVALDWIVLKRSLRAALWSTALWWPMSIACMVMARIEQTTLGAIPPPLWARPLVALDAIAFYLKHIVWPAALGVDYGRTPEAVLQKGWAWWTWLVPATIASLLVWKPRRELIAAGLILLIAVSPVLGLTPFMFQFYSTVADHYLYLAMLGPALGLAWVVTKWPNRMVIGGSAGAVIVLAALSVKQCAAWRDDQALYDQAIAVNPDSFMSYNNLGSAFAHTADVATVGADVAEKVGDSEGAKAYRQQARIGYESALANFARGAAVRRKVTGGKDDFLKAHGNLAVVYSRLGHNELALRHRRRALEIYSAYPVTVPQELASVHLLIGQDLIKLGRIPQAVQSLETAVKLDPGNKMVAEARAKARAALATIDSEPVED